MTTLEIVLLCALLISAALCAWLWRMLVTIAERAKGQSDLLRTQGDLIEQQRGLINTQREQINLLNGQWRRFKSNFVGHGR